MTDLPTLEERLAEERPLTHAERRYADRWQNHEQEALVAECWRRIAVQMTAQAEAYEQQLDECEIAINKLRREIKWWQRRCRAYYPRIRGKRI